jgi:hypothetical protein
VARRYVVLIVPHRDRTFDRDRPLTTAQELLERHRERFSSEEDRHWSVWNAQSFAELCEAAGLRVLAGQDPDDKVGNGFTVVIDASAEIEPRSDPRTAASTDSAEMSGAGRAGLSRSAERTG